MALSGVAVAVPADGAATTVCAPTPMAPARKFINTAAVTIHRNARAIMCSFLVADEGRIFGRVCTADK
jgi:predicted transcriptional regulator